MLRRQFMKGMLAATGTLPLTAAAYYGYKEAGDVVKKNPVKTALIGAGDEGGVLVGEHNPEYLEFVAVCDIRPYNQERIFKGEDTGPRKGFQRIYGKDARKNIKLYTDEEQMKEMLKRKDIEAVVIALPLHLHESVAIECMKAGKHVLCEKLMAWNVSQCKEMIRTAEETKRICNIGHQRHYSMLYAHAVEVLQSEVLGDIRHIRAQWHRNNSWPRLDPKTGMPLKDGKTGLSLLRDGWNPAIPKDDQEELAGQIKTTRLQERRRACPLATLQPHRRRPDGGAGQSPARRVQHLPGQGPPAGRLRRGVQVLLQGRP